MPQFIIPGFGRYVYSECRTPRDFVNTFEANDAAGAASYSGALMAYRKRGSKTIHVTFHRYGKEIWHKIIKSKFQFGDDGKLFDLISEKWKELGDQDKPPSDEDMEALRKIGVTL